MSLGQERTPLRVVQIPKSGSAGSAGNICGVVVRERVHADGAACVHHAGRKPECRFDIPVRRIVVWGLGFSSSTSSRSNVYRSPLTGGGVKAACKDRTAFPACDPEDPPRALLACAGSKREGSRLSPV